MNIIKVIASGAIITFVLAACVSVLAIANRANAQTVPTCSIYATSSSGSGQPVTLSWNSTNTTYAFLNPGASVAVNGSQLVYPTTTTTYTLTVNGAQGYSGNCQTTVYVSTTSVAPSCWITLSQYNYNYNQQATLSWGSTNATSAYINPSVGSISTSGSQTVYPSGNQSYTMTVYNAQGQSATCQTSYVPSGAISCTITANPVNIQNGNSSYLSWTSTGATSAYLSDGLGNVAPNGSLTVRPENSRNYTLTVTGSNGTQTCNTYVTVSGSYISLTQIPYTGFDFGPIGNTLYWFALAGFAVAAGYLIVYFLPLRRMRFARTNSNAAIREEDANSATIISERITVPAIFANEKPEFAVTSSSVDTLEELPILHAEVPGHNGSTVKDSMAFSHSKEGSAPHIVIKRV